MKRKVVILGAGHVGSHAAFSIARRGLAEEIVLVDTDAAKAAAQALDAADSLSSEGTEACIRSGSHAECEGASLIITAIGEPRKPGQTRLDLFARSTELISILAEQLKPFAITCPVISITNPADIMAHLLRTRLGLSRAQCFSTGTLLDSARLRRIIAEKLGIDRRSVQAFALGEHGDSSMVPFSCCTAQGLPLDRFSLSVEEIEEKTHLAGMDIINGKGSTEFGIGAAAADMAAAILRNEHRLMAASPLLEGEYGWSGIHCGVPCIIGAAGVEQVIELPLTPEEQSRLDRSCSVIRSHIQKLQA